MGSRHHSRRTVIVLVVLLELATPLSALVRPARVSAAISPATLFALTNLGTLGGKNSAATALNGRQQVVGWSEPDEATDEDFHAFRYGGSGGAGDG